MYGLAGTWNDCVLDNCIGRWYLNGCLSESDWIKIKPSASQGGKPYGDLGL